MQSKITVVGIGPGSRNYLTPIALSKIEEADVLAGSEKIVNIFSSFRKETFAANHTCGNFDKLFDFLKDNFQNKKIVVLVSGDTGLYSLAKNLSKEFEEDKLEFVPGISSVSLFFSKLKKTYENVKIVSLHGRNINNLKDELACNKKICILTDKNNQVIMCKIVEGLRLKGVAWIGNDLSYPDEYVAEVPVSKLSKQIFGNNTIIYLELD